VGGHRAEGWYGERPALLYGEPDLTVRVIRDIFNEDFKQARCLR
jgi:ribonuclease E